VATESYQTQLERIQTAIGEIESGAQDVTYDGKRVRRADLDVLYAREDRLRRLTARAARAGIRVRLGTPV
jgi:hypothetical protein